MGRGRRTTPFSLPPGSEVFIVGGALRDELLGYEPKDRDWALGGVSPEEVEAHLEGAEVLEVAGQRIGWRLPGGEELALLRREQSTGPLHTDFQTETDGVTIEEDLRRRDFTCNAIAQNIRTGEILDPLGGIPDIQAGRLRAVSPEAFREDPLRLLRGANLVARFGLRPDRDTLEWMKGADTSHLSPERIWGELRRILVSPNAADALRMLRDIGQYEKLFPELEGTLGFDQESRYHNLSCDEHCLRALDGSPENETLRLAAWLHDAGKPVSAWRGSDGRLHYYARGSHRDHAETGAEIADSLLRRLCVPKQIQEDVCYLVLHHMWAETRQGWAEMSEAKRDQRARRFVMKHNRYAPLLIELRRADASAKGKDVSEELQALDDFEQRVLRAQEGSWRTLEIDGNDLLDLGFRGESIGQVLEELQKRVCDNPHLNERQRLLGWAEKML